MALRQTLEFGLDEALQFEVRHLQKLDRLLQLRRHHQGLALPKLHSLNQRHEDLAPALHAEAGA